jgi:hypothetical protein
VGACFTVGPISPSVPSDVDVEMTAATARVDRNP